MVPGYFHWKMEETLNQKKPLAVWIPAYLLCLPALEILVTDLYNQQSKHMHRG